MADLNKMQPAELRAAMRGGTAAWGQMGSVTDHVRYKVPLPKVKARRQCHCGCGGKSTYACMANGVCLTRGCELSAQRWVKTGSTKPLKDHP